MDLHFAGRSPFSRQKSSLNGLGAIWAEDSSLYYAHSACHSRGTPGLPRVRFAQGVPHSGCNKPGPPWPACRSCAGQSRTAHLSSIRKHDRRQPPNPCQPLNPHPACGWRLSSCYSNWEGAPWPFAIPVCHLQACPFPGSLPAYTKAINHWRLKDEIQVPVLVLSKATAWSCELLTSPNRKRTGLLNW